jgi:hypothetical protein
MPQVLSLPRMSMGLLSAVARPKTQRPDGLSMAHTLRDLRVHLGVRRELLSRRFRSHVVVSGSEHANAEPPAYRAGSASASKPRPTNSITATGTASETGSGKPAHPARGPRPTPNGDSVPTNPPTATTTAADDAAERGANPQEVSA